MAGTANRPLADSVAGVLGIEPASVTVERFPDGELRPDRFPSPFTSHLQRGCPVLRGGEETRHGQAR
ncbi:hypothetical protein [Streptosporangium sp. NPDC006007]|uniref:hypothetical protein n=1 Tax=Streptosporangium sp. NPDC006007 TaxID=3154575 RepID=UPI0033BC1FFE